MADKVGNERYAEYGNFVIDSESNGYRLAIGSYVQQQNAAGINWKENILSWKISAMGLITMLLFLLKTVDFNR